MALREAAKRVPFAQTIYRFLLRQSILLRTHRRLGSHRVELGDDFHMRRHYLDDDYYAPFHAWIGRWLEPGQTAVDVGAHVGFTAIVMSDRVGPTGRVLAVEPSPSVLEVLHRNVRAIPNITVCPVAIAATPGTRQLFANTEHAGMTSFDSSNADTMKGEGRIDEHTVETLPLDQLMQRNGAGVPDFIKIDAQGAEYEILRGSLDWLIEHKNSPLVIDLEFEPRAITNISGAGAPEKMLRLLEDRGFGVLDAEDFPEQILGERFRDVDEYVRCVASSARRYTNLIVKC